MLKSIRKLLRRMMSRTRNTGWGRPQKPMTLRRWAAAQKDRLNKAHWAKVTANPINVDLQTDLPTIRARCMHERQNNGFFDGVVNTHKTDLIGGDGPIFHAQTDNDGYRDALERGWSEFWGMPDINGMLSGADFLQLWIDDLWCNSGEILSLIVKADPLLDRDMLDAESQKWQVGFRMQALAGNQLDTPHDQAGRQNIFMGIEFSRTGRPEQYWIQEFQAGDAARYTVPTFKPHPPKNVIHEFRNLEAGQLRGVPWAAPVLPVIGDLRDYNDASLDAARAAADWAITLYSDHPDAPYFPLNASSMEVERRRYNSIPPGWKIEQLRPEHPTTQYKEFFQERLRELGRPVGMPLMMILADSNGHNYSSARFDAQIYYRTLQALQRWIERQILNRLVRKVERELQLMGKLPAKRPPDLKLAWTWPVPPHVDPAKEAIADEIELQTGMLDLYEACAKRSRNFESVVANRKRSKAALEDAGLPLGPGLAELDEDDSGTASTTKTPDQVTPGGDDESDDTGTSAGEGAGRIAPRRRRRARRAGTPVTLDLGDGMTLTRNGSAH